MFSGHRLGYRAMLGVVTLYSVTASAVAKTPLFFAYDDRPSLHYLVFLGLPVLAWYALVTLRLMLRRRPDPLIRLLRYSRQNRKPLLRTFLLIAVMVLWASAFNVVKIQIPRLNFYWADAMLAATDRALLGTDAWRLTHTVIGDAGTVFLDRLYVAWFTVMLGVLAWAIYSRDVMFQLQSLLSFLLTWVILGSLLATALASVGPCFYEQFYGRADFAPLIARLEANPRPLIALIAMDYLREVHGTVAHAGGISAMPSLHVGIAVWCVLVAREGSRSRVPVTLAVIFAALILIGSVHLGWHYLSDGLVSILLTPVIWALVRRFLALRPAPLSPQRSKPA